MVGRRRFTCHDCGFKYSTKAKLAEHAKSHVAASKEKTDVSCSNCSKVFASGLLLKRHQVLCKKLSNQKDNVSAKVTESQKADPLKRPTDNEIDKIVSKMQTILDSKKMQLNGGTFSPTKSLALIVNKSAASSVSIENMSLLIKNSLKSINTQKTCVVAVKSSVQPLSKKTATRSQSKTTKVAASETATDKNIAKPPGRKTRASKTSIPKASSPNKKQDSPQNETIAVKGTTVTAKLPGRTTRRKGKRSAADAKMESPSRKKSKVLTSVKALIDDDNDDEDDDDDAAIVKDEEVKNDDDDDSLKKPFSCALCSKVFSRKYHLDRHLRLSPCSGLPPLSFPCELCNRVYSRKDNLREHLRQHTGESHRVKKHKCAQCGKAFHGQSLLAIHVRTHTGEKPFSCEYCPKKFSSAGAVNKHIRTHTGERPFKCDECGLEFSLKGTLKRHVRVHTGVRPHKCSYCGKQFIQIGGLRAHMFYHTGENGFSCDECGKTFNRKARLEMHKLYVHLKHKPFICEHCPKSFTRKEDLNRHAILHTGEKPYKCPHCTKTFSIKPSLKLHLLTHTREEPRSCHECGRAFIRKDCLLRHMRKRHRDLLDKILLDEKDEKFGDTATTSRMLGEEDLCENITELLSLLVEESTLTGFGWPNKPVDEVLEAVIRRCGHTPIDASFPFMDRMRENAKLLFTVVIDDNAIKTLLNNQTVDEVILHVLRLAKT